MKMLHKASNRDWVCVFSRQKGFHVNNFISDSALQFEIFFLEYYAKLCHCSNVYIDTSFSLIIIPVSIFGQKRDILDGIEIYNLGSACVEPVICINECERKIHRPFYNDCNYFSLLGLMWINIITWANVHQVPHGATMSHDDVIKWKQRLLEPCQ